MRYALPAILVAGALAWGCVAPREEPAPPPRASVPAPVPAPIGPAPVIAVEPPVGWADLPDTPGAWSLDGAGQASFAGQFTLRCDRVARALALARTGASGPLTVTTTTGVRQVVAPLPASDGLLDAMAFSRGHFTVDAPGLSRLVIPAHPEITRVVEDCRA